MARHEETRSYPHMSSDQCFQAAEKALPLAGFEVYKTRPIAWLVLSKHMDGIDTVNANMMARPGGTVTLSIGGDKFNEEAIRAYAQKIFEVYESVLLKPGKTTA